MVLAVRVAAVRLHNQPPLRPKGYHKIAYRQDFNDCMTSWPDLYGARVRALEGDRGRANSAAALYNALTRVVSVSNANALVDGAPVRIVQQYAGPPGTGQVLGFDFPGDFSSFDAVAKAVYGFDPTHSPGGGFIGTPGEAYTAASDRAALLRMSRDLVNIRTSFRVAARVLGLYQTAPPEYQFTALVSAMDAQLAIQRGLQDADRSRYETYCRGEAARLNPETQMTPTPSTVTTFMCPPGFRRVELVDPFTQQSIWGCEPIQVRAPVPSIPTIAPTPPRTPQPTGPSTPVAPAPVIVPCPDGQERIGGMGDCVPECGDGQFRNAMGECEDNPVEDPTCPRSAAAVSTLPIDISATEVQALTSTGDYTRSFSGAGNRTMTESVRQVRNAGGTCVTVWPAPFAIEGYTVARGDNGVVVYTAVPDAPVTPNVPVPTEQAACEAGGGVWNAAASRCDCPSGTRWEPSSAACVAIEAEPDREPVSPFGGLTGNWMLFPKNGSEIDIEIGTQAGWSGVVTDTPGYSVIAEHAPGNFRYETVAADDVNAGSDPRFNNWRSPVFSNVFTIAPVSRNEPIGSARPLIGGGIAVRVYNRFTRAITGDSPAEVENFLITPVADATRPKLVIMRITRRDRRQFTARDRETQELSTGMALQLGGVGIYVRYFRESEPTPVAFSRSGDPTKPEGLSEAQSLAYDAYHPLAVTYGKNEQALPGARWTLVDGLAQGARILRTNGGEAVLPYRNVITRYTARNHPDAARIIPGQWVRFGHDIQGERYDFEANVQRVSFTGNWRGEYELAAESAISPRSLEHAILLRLEPGGEGEIAPSPDAGELSG